MFELTYLYLVHLLLTLALFGNYIIPIIVGRLRELGEVYIKCLRQISKFQ